jgi:hypothetical protein
LIFKGWAVTYFQPFFELKLSRLLFIFGNWLAILTVEAALK